MSRADLLGELGGPARIGIGHQQLLDLRVPGQHLRVEGADPPSPDERGPHGIPPETDGLPGF